MNPEKSDEIWVAEENEDPRILLAWAFRRIGSLARLVFFPKGSELVHHVQTHRTLPKLLLLDLQMPVIDGLDALKAMRAEGCSGVSPMVVFSSVENPESVRDAYFSGAKLYIKKPEDLDGYKSVAALCENFVDPIRDIPSGAIPLEALDIKNALKIVGNREETLK
jgi:CheY-like chemotaxis protein